MLNRLKNRIVALSEWILPEAESTEKPEQGEFKSGVRNDLDVTRRLRRSNNPETLAASMNAADIGDVSAAMELYEEVEKDPRVSRLTYKRKNNVLGNDFVIAPADDTTQAQQAADICNAMIFGDEKYAGIDNFDSALFDLSDAIFKGFAVGQTVWSRDGGKIIPVTIKQWSQREFTFGSIYSGSSNDQDHDDIRVLTDSHMVDGERLAEFPDGTWIVHVHKSWSQPICRAALAKSVTWFWMFKRMGYRDLSIWLERFGVPMRKATYGENASEKEREELWTAVVNMGKDHACIHPDGSTIELLELHGTSGEAPHPVMIKHCNEEIDVAIMGSTMSVTQGERGARSAKEAFTNDEHEQTKADSKKLAMTIKKQLCIPIIKYNLGENYPAPKCFFQLADNDNLETRSKVDKTISEIGYPITYGHISDKYSMPLPDGFERDDVIESKESATQQALSSIALAEKKKILKLMQSLKQ